jgi:hypothetical protein
MSLDAFHSLAMIPADPHSLLAARKYRTACRNLPVRPKSPAPSWKIGGRGQLKQRNPQLGLALLSVLFAVCMALMGCGMSGYAGGGISSLSNSAITIDAGQSFPFTAALSGNALVSWSLSGSSCSSTACGSLSSTTGTKVTYTAPANLSSQMKVKLIAEVAGTSNITTAEITVNPDPVISGTPPSGTVGAAYSGTLTATGGTAPLKWSMSGALPAGLTFNAGKISGEPTAVGSSSFTAQIIDSSDVPYTVNAAESIAIAAPSGGGGGGSSSSLTISGQPAAGTVGVAYSASFLASGGTAPYSWTILSGSLPSGLTLSASSGTISGTPSSAGTSVFTLQALDAKGNQASAPFSILIKTASTPLTLTLSTLPGATVGVPYSATVGVSGGSAPYSCLEVGGSLPAGLSLAANCVVSGTPTTAGISVVMVKASDASSPAETITGPESITVSAASSLSLTLSTLPGATVGVPYSATIGVSGGTAPYNCNIISGVLPAGLTESSCLISGTPTVAGTVQLMVKATDSSSPVETVTGPETLIVSPAPLSLTLSNLPSATVGTPYSATIGVAGGTAPYNCTILSGTLQAGLSISGCVVSGTPTVAGSVTLQVKATDSSSSVETVTGPVGLTVLPAATLTLTSPPSGTVGIPYSGPIGVGGGTAPYTCTLVSGTLPAGLTLNGCIISGTPTTAGSSTITVKGTDSSNPTDTTTGPVTVTVLPAATSLTLSSPPNATVDVPYSGTIGVSGGTAPYNCSITAGSLPAGLTLGSGCAITGTPTTAGTSTVTVNATDSANPVASKTGPVTITVLPIPKLTLTGSLPNATLGVPYTQTLVATGGLTPYSYSITAGALPAGLTMSTAGVISGTPTAVGASSFTATVTDTEPTPQTASLPLVLLVVYPTTANDAEFVGPYAYLFASQTATAASFTADGTGVVSGGEMDANHASSNPSGNTISSNAFLGTYTIGTDNTGFLTLTTLNADGTTGATATYAMTVKAPIAPATVANQASMIEFDDDQLSGTKGSGNILAQQASAFTGGLTGSYAFGISGDSPCLPTCTIGIIAGPAAAVGQFTANSTGQLTGGTSDANLASTNYADAALSGSYAAVDGNGRVALTMDTANMPAGVYPTDYAVYRVSANQAFILSTDKHADYVLLAGTARLQTQASFSNASMNSAFIGYENAQSNPGLLGTTLQNTLNLSTATIFRATGNGAGSCDTTNVDVGGATALVNGLTGLGSGSNVLNALLGTYQSTGTSVCTVAANGRGVLNYPVPNNLLSSVLALLGLPANAPAPREFYLVSPNTGYFLETGYAGLGQFRAQTGSPFSLATLDGTYVYASQPASSVASINSSGTFAANGTGSATTTLDLNVGVGTINVLQTGVTNTSNYTLTDATAGRYLFNTTTVVYAISPTSFVLVDTNPLTTSPSISLLY